MELVQRRGPIDSRGEVQRVCHGSPADSHGPSAYKTSRKPLIVRIGINLGDIIIDGDDICGDGVNVAARLEGLAEPGGVCIRRAVRNLVRDKLPYVYEEYEDLGEIEVKNIARPIRVFRVVVDDAAPPRPVGPATKPSKTWRWPATAPVAGL